MTNVSLLNYCFPGRLQSNTNSRSMNFQQDPSSIHFMEFITKWSSIFTITPWYSFRKHRLIGKNIFKIYASFVTLFTLIMQAALLYVYFKVFLRDVNTIFKIMFSILEINVLFFYISAGLGTAFWNMFNWQRIFNLSRRLEINNSLHCRRIKKASIVTNSNFIFIVGSICGFLTYAIYTLRWATLSYKHMIIASNKLFYYYFEFLFSSVVINVAVSIKYKYGVMNETIINIISREGRGDTLSTIKKTKIFFLATGEIVKEFNKLFGWSMLIVLVQCVLDLLSSIAVIITSVEGTAKSLLIHILLKVVTKVRRLKLL